MIWPKPNPQSLMGIMGLFLIGCVSIKTHESGEHEAYIRGLQKARVIAHRQGCDEAVKIISGKIDVEEMKP